MQKIVKIKTEELQNYHLPPPDASWDEISLFALSWDPISELKDVSFPYSSRQPPTDDATILEIRAYIYTEQRWWNNRSSAIDENSLH